MNDRDAKKERDRIRKVLDLWIERTGLTGWAIDIQYDRSTRPANSPRGSVAEASVAWPYRRATLTFWLLGTAPYDDLVLEEIVVHELMHIQVNEMREHHDLHHEERVCTELARMIVQLGQGSAS